MEAPELSELYPYGLPTRVFYFLGRMYLGVRKPDGGFKVWPADNDPMRKFDHD